VDIVVSEIDLIDPDVAQLVHDLRHQLRALLSCVGALRDGLPHGQADRLSELQHSADRVLLLINAIDVRPQPSERRLVDVTEVVRRTAASLPRFQDDAISLRLDLWPEPVGVLAERGVLDRVLLNLLLNAYDAMPVGGVLTIETAVAEIGRPTEGFPPGPYARLTVRDTGCGMTAAVKDRVFDAFFSTKTNGTGLGLHSVACTIQQLDGRTSVESEPGRGTSVTVMLPLALKPPF